MPKLVLITGASRGYGRAVSLEFAKKEKNVHFLLLGRSKDGLNETAGLINGKANCFSIDLNNLVTLESEFDKVLSSIDPSAYSTAYLFNNAGTTGEVKKVRDLTSLKSLQENMDNNVTSCMWITRTFLKKFENTQTIIVNVSSSAAVDPIETWSAYCSGKAAREMFHNVIAAEEKDNELVKVLNWSPGVMHTSMQDGLQKTVDSPIRTFLGNAIRSGKATTVEESAGELIKFLGGDFKSGHRVDLYSVRPDLGQRLNS